MFPQKSTSGADVACARFVAAAKFSIQKPVPTSEETGTGNSAADNAQAHDAAAAIRDIFPDAFRMELFFSTFLILIFRLSFPLIVNLFG